MRVDLSNAARLSHAGRALALGLAFWAPLFCAAGAEPRIEPCFPELDLLRAGQALTAGGIAALEGRLATHPGDLQARGTLIASYFLNALGPPRMEHILWLIEHRPESNLLDSRAAGVARRSDVLNSIADYERARALWTVQVGRRPNDARVLARAARFLSPAYLDEATALWKRARRLEPDNRECTWGLAQLYAACLTSELAPAGGIAPHPCPPSDFASAARRELDDSLDAELVGAVGSALTQPEVLRLASPEAAWVEHLRSVRQSTAPYGEQLLARALALDPDNPVWQDRLERARRARAAGYVQAIPAIAEEGRGRVRVEAGLQNSILIEGILPDLPPGFQASGGSSRVVFEAVVDRWGRVRQSTAISGDPALVPAAREALKQWRYQPRIYHGRPVEVVTEISVSFYPRSAARR